MAACLPDIEILELARQALMAGAGVAAEARIQAEAVAEKLRGIVARQPIVHRGHGIAITLSLGVAAHGLRS